MLTTSPTDLELRAWDWRAELRRQERTITWLGRHTNRAARTVYAYAYGERDAPLEWLRAAYALLTE